jgi:hypothetical protein
MSKIQLNEDLWLCSHFLRSGWIWSTKDLIWLRPNDKRYQTGKVLAMKFGYVIAEDDYLRLTPLGLAMMKLLQ